MEKVNICKEGMNGSKMLQCMLTGIKRRGRGEREQVRDSPQ